MTRRHSTPTLLTLTLLAATTLGSAGARAETAPPDPASVVVVPSPDLGEDLLGARADAQRRAIGGVEVDHDFTLTDRLPESGITFRHLSTDDGGRDYKMVHYDHGNAVAAADVDGDSRADLYFVNQLGSNELWRNRGDGTFEDWTGRAGVGLADRVSVAASFADVDDDGDPDLFVTTVAMGNVLFENLGGGKFRDITERAGVGGRGTHSSGAVFFDFDLDGDLDLFVTNVGRYTADELGRGGYRIGVPDAFQGHLHPDRTERSDLYRNRGDGTFEEVSEALGLVEPRWNGDAAFADLDGDRYPELYVANMQGDDSCWDNLDGKRFEEIRKTVFPSSPWGTMGVAFFDWNGDTLLDLILTDMHSDMSQEVPPFAEKIKSDMQWSEAYLEGSDDNIFGNALWRNLGEDGFEEVSDLVGAENYWPWGVSVADLNADGWNDVFIASSMSYPWRYGVNSMLLNDGGRRFVDAEFLVGVEPRRDGRTKVPYFELDCSGADSEHERCSGREGKVTVYGNLGTRSSVFLDLDDDGDLDLVTGEFHAEPQVLVSDLAQRGSVRFLKVELRGTRSNRNGLGALVTLTAGGRQQVRWVDGKSGYLAQSVLPLYFGLGDAPAIDRLEVLWPSGVRQVLTEGLEVGTLVTVKEE